MIRLGKFLLWLLAGVLVICLSGGCFKKVYVPHPGPGSGVKVFIDVVTYNIKIGLEDFNKVEQNLININADIIFLQDLYINQAYYLSQQTGTNGFFGNARDTQRGPYGLAILTKYPILEGEVHRLPNLEGEEQEILLAAKIEVPLPGGGTGPLWVYNTHLISNSKNNNDASKLRLLQAQRMTAIILDKQVSVYILGGDFNAWGFSSTKRHLRYFFLDVSTFGILSLNPSIVPQGNVSLLLSETK